MRAAPLALALALACAVGQCLGFNLDVKFPMVFSKPELNDSALFGVSVLLQARSWNSAPWIQIGAPKSSGKAFRCPIGGRCRQVNFDRNGIDFKDDDFVGGTMASQSADSPGIVVVCGSRWREPLPNFGTYLYQGICNWMDGADRSTSQPPAVSNQWVAPLVRDDTKSLLRTVPGHKAVYDLALGQAGFSAHFPRTDSETIVLGAPGVLNWRGTLLYCPYQRTNWGGEGGRRSAQPQGRQGARASGLTGAQHSLEGPSCAIAESNLGEFSYLGYEVTSGRFFSQNEILLVAGAPRGAYLHGEVHLYSKPLYDGKQLVSVTSLKGTALGAYFGSSLAVGDFNGDGFDDLAVGAPLTVTGAQGLTDDGLVHQFLGGNLVGSARSLERPRTVNDGKLTASTPGGRFGYSLACRNLDKDKYADLVVGSPYEDNSIGVVYVFSGGPQGLVSTPSQRITARALQLPLLRGFGISLAPAADIDDNKFADVAVGTLGAAVILRAHPVITLTTTLTTQHPRVPQNATRTTVRACITFTGPDAPKEISVVRTLNVSSDHDLAQLIDSTNTKLRAIVTNLRLTNNVECEDIDIDIKIGSKYLDVIAVQLSARLDTKILDDTPGRMVDGENLARDKFPKTFPVSRRAAEPATLRLEFENECENQTCVADLRLRCHFLSDGVETTRHVVGSRTPLTLSVGAENGGEPAYATQLSVTLPGPVALVKIPAACELDEANARLLCELRDLTPQRNSSSVLLGLDMSAVVDANAPLEFVVTATTRSKQQVEDNRETVKLDVFRNASLAIYGKAVGRASYRYDGANASAQEVEFAHEFTVSKLGESPIESAVLSVRFVTGWRASEDDKLVTLLSAHRPEVLQDGQPLNCETSVAFLNETTNSEGLDADDVRAKREVTPSNERLTSADQPKVDQLPANQTLFLDCATSGVVCGTISCTARTLREQSQLRMTLRMRLDTSKLGGLLGRKSIASLATWADVVWASDVEGIQANAKANASTLFIGVAEAERVESWIIALSIGGGLLVFSFLVMGLIKAGFFQRKQKMEMEALIEQEAEIEATTRQSMMPAGSDIEDD